VSTTRRRRFSAEFKAKVAREAIRGDQSINELACRYELHPNMITHWKRQAIDNMAVAFSGGAESSKKADDAQSRNFTTRSVNSRLSGIFWPKPSVAAAESDAKEIAGRTGP
jgi:transposase